MPAHPGRHRHRPAQQPGLRWPQLVQTVVLGGSVALVVLGTLIYSEATVAQGTYAPMAAGWCVLLLLWAVSVWLGREERLTLGWTELAGAGFVGWHSLAAFVALGAGNGRQTLNAQWLIISYGLAVFLLRQTLVRAAQVRSLLVAMLWLATLVASFGFYQYFYSLPRNRREYEANPEKALIEHGYPIERGSPQRELFENRVRSVEPLGTFALTNSLAGFLAPWLIVAASAGLSAAADRGQRRALAAMAAIAVFVAGCLLLTKSRTAYLAVVAGAVLLALSGRRGGWRLDWRIPAAATAVLAVLGLTAAYFGGLDVQVLSEAPKSVRYRVEYWQATAALIADHPIFGCGPGNFQESYAAYKLPQASETVSDPHNFVLEIWATAGTPGVVLLLLVMAAFAADLGGWAAGSGNRAATGEGDGATIGGATTAAEVHAVSQRAVLAILGGALAGLMIASPVATLVGFPLESLPRPFDFLPVTWLLGVPLWVAFWWLFRPWIDRGRAGVAGLVVAQMVLLINLLAAGAVVFPGVMGTLLVLGPAALYLAKADVDFTFGGGEQHSYQAGANRSLASDGIVIEEGCNRSAEGYERLPKLFRQVRLSPKAAGLVTIGALVLTIACLKTEYVPVVTARWELNKAVDALLRGNFRGGHTAALAAARADAYWPEPWRLLAHMSLELALRTNRAEDWQSFEVAVETFSRLDPCHHAGWQTRGNWHLAAWRKRKQAGDLKAAIDAYRKAVQYNPNRAVYHAQLAWALHLAGENELASREAEEARRLDDLMPHAEQKLSRHKIFDPEEGAGTAEQIVQRLRSIDEEKSP